MLLAENFIKGTKACLPDRLFLSISHRRKIGRFPNLRNPKTFNEKILSRCLNPDPRYVDLTDKLKVREHVAQRIGDEHLVPLLEDPDFFTEEVYDRLPSAFVMKANHGSGFVKIVKDKSRVPFKELSALAEEWLSIDFYRVARERHYRLIRRRVFFEALLLGDNGEVPADLKVHVFNGKSNKQTIFIAVVADRFSEDPRADIYDTDWIRQEVCLGYYAPSESPAPAPQRLDTLLHLAKSLATDFEFVRVDAYEVNGKVYFGELTFTPGAGALPMRPDAVDYEWGKLF